MAKHALAGSERQALPGARSIGKTDPSERLETTVLLRRRAADAFKARVEKLGAGGKHEGHLSREEFARQFGADPADAGAVKKFADQHGLVVVQQDLGRRTMVLSGTV